MSYTGVVFNQRVPLNVNRDALEKARINDRIGFQTRFQTAGNLIFQPDKASSLFVQDKQRFNKDHDANDKAKRNEDRQKLQNFYEKRRDKRIEKDQQRWNNYLKKDQKQEQKRLHHQKVLADNKRNTSGLAYNPITLGYEKSSKGEQLRKQDEQKNVRRFVRAQNIMDKNNYGYNLITGEQREGIKQMVPEELKVQVQQRIAAKKANQVIKYEPKKDKYDYLDD